MKTSRAPSAGNGGRNPVRGSGFHDARSIWAMKWSGVPSVSFGHSKLLGALGTPPIHDVASSERAKGEWNSRAQAGSCFARSALPERAKKSAIQSYIGFKTLDRMRDGSEAAAGPVLESVGDVRESVAWLHTLTDGALILCNWQVVTRRRLGHPSRLPPRRPRGGMSQK